MATIRQEAEMYAVLKKRQDEAARLTKKVSHEDGSAFPGRSCKSLRSSTLYYFRMDVLKCLIVNNLG